MACGATFAATARTPIKKVFCARLVDHTYVVAYRDNVMITFKLWTRSNLPTAADSGSVDLAAMKGVAEIKHGDEQSSGGNRSSGSRICIFIAPSLSFLLMYFHCSQFIQLCAIMDSNLERY